MLSPAVFGIYGPSDSGKTTLVENLVEHFTRQHYQVATVKCTNKSLSLDTRGKDTWRHHAAGSKLVVFSSARETDFLLSASMTIAEILGLIAAFGAYDLVLVEGANDPDIPKIQIGTGRKRAHTVVSYTNNFDETVKVIKKALNVRSSTSRLTVIVNGKNIPLTEFPKHILSNSIVGMLSSLKGVQTIQNVTITLQR
jgi:molybdopterin-guanine dinucleotide biosynthesis protein MobB